MLNKKGDNMERVQKELDNRIKQTSLRSDLWSLVHEVSKLDENLARKLDIVCSDLQEVQFRLGLDRGCEIGSATISELVEMKENYKFGGNK
jgi:hypothetical protein